MKALEKYGVSIPKILLPKNIDLSTWSVIACDQYTQEVDYWKNAEKIAEGKPSTLNLIFPEVYLSTKENEERIKKIKETMLSYIKDGVFEPEQRECVYVERKTSYGRTRRGLVLCIDLDKYDWKPFSKAPIRATEATVPERIPPRMKIRNNAPLELPHIMLLANDKKDLLVGGAEKLSKKANPIYDGSLMQESGHITGWALKGEEAETLLDVSIQTLATEGTDKNGDIFLFAVGDGNHSLATAKAVWEENKANLPKDSPVRYALVEIVNIYDRGLTFEPIHRALFDLNGEELLSYLAKTLNGKIIEKQDEQSLEKSVAERNSEGARYGFIFVKDGKPCFKLLQTSIKTLAISSMQPALDVYLNEKGADKTQIDYIHGTKETVELGKKDKNIGILLPPIEKDSFFLTINGNGPLPRKSFSMGEASEKRFYVESRRLF